MFFSIIIPVFNRPDEIKELLDSLLKQDFQDHFEIIIVEDGSSISSEKIIDQFKNQLDISYYYKNNSGPGDSRNFGMRVAKGYYFIIFDSDCIIPLNYLSEVHKELSKNYVECFGGKDAALDSFSDIQKAINFTMTSFLTTGGIRGSSEKINKFQPRSFNMGISKKAFIASNGFSNIHPGEDPDLSIRLWKMGYNTLLFEKAFVYHKRRINWEKFLIQVSKFGKARPILDSWYPEYSKITFAFPTLFIISFLVSILLFLLYSFSLLFFSFLIYFLAIIIVSTLKNKSLKVGLLSFIALSIQFYGYGTGFLVSFLKIKILKIKPEIAFPELFYTKK